MRGKILSDVIDSIIRQKLQEKRKGSMYSLTALIGKCQSLMCFHDKNTDMVYVEPANKQVKTCYDELGVAIPTKLDLKSYLNELFVEAMFIVLHLHLS